MKLKGSDATEQTAFVEQRRWPRTALPPGEAAAPPPALTPLHFSTRDLEPSRQFPAWQAFISPLMDVRLPDGISPEASFPVDHTVWHLGDMLLVQQSTPAFRYERSIAKLRFSPIDHWQVSFLHSGRTWTEIDGRVAENMSGKMEIRSLGHPFRGRTLEAAAVMLILPSDLFADKGGLPGTSNNVVIDGHFADLLSSYVASLETGLCKLTAGDLPKIVGRVREMVIDSTSRLPEPKDEGGRFAHIGLMVKARRFIQKNLSNEDLSPDTLCRELAISRTKLYELFETYGGVLNYIRSRRLQMAHAALADPGNSQRILDIANSVGFDSAANFSHAFSQEFGCSPRVVRSQSGTYEAQNSDKRAGFGRKERSFSNWLQDLGRSHSNAAANSRADE